MSPTHVGHQQSACSTSSYAFIAEHTRFLEIPQSGSGPGGFVSAVPFTKLLALSLLDELYVQASILV
jgi:hypothetical protein